MVVTRNTIQPEQVAERVGMIGDSVIRPAARVLYGKRSVDGVLGPPHTHSDLNQCDLVDDAASCLSQLNGSGRDITRLNLQR